MFALWFSQSNLTTWPKG